MTLQGTIEKSPILLSQYWTFEWLDGTIIIWYLYSSCWEHEIKFAQKIWYATIKSKGLCFAKFYAQFIKHHLYKYYNAL